VAFQCHEQPGTRYSLRLGGMRTLISRLRWRVTFDLSIPRSVTMNDSSVSAAMNDSSVGAAQEQELVIDHSNVHRMHYSE
jgi:hypothetical protein